MKNKVIKGKIRRIFLDHWDEFCRLYGHRIRKNIFREVEKMITCGSIENGYIGFKCGACGEEHKVGFTCKSRLCSSCGKKRTDDWVLKFSNKISTAQHRHMVFTIPKEIRIYFGENRRLLSILPKCAAETIQTWIRDRYKKISYTPGLVGVIHTFGRDLKWNPHVHMLVTKGEIGEDLSWKKTNFFPYEMLRKRWQKILLDRIEESLTRNDSKKEFKKLKNALYNNLKNGFYVYGQGEVNNSKAAAKYIGRYAARPAIAESRIINYDGRIVSFEYTDHKDKKKKIVNIDALEFIKRVIRHVPDKNFKMVRYYGFYAQNNKFKEIVPKLLDDKTYEELKKLSRWKYRILKEFGVDPLKCPNCGKVMELNEVVIGQLGNCLNEIYRKMREETKKKINQFREIDNIFKRRNNGIMGAIFN